MKKNILPAIAALALSFALIGTYATTAESQYPSQETSVSISEMLRVPLCPNKNFLVFSMNYPTNTGNTQVDAFFQKHANDTMTEYKNMVADMGENECDMSSKMHANINSIERKPNVATLGILETVEYYMGGAHGGTDVKSFNFDLRTGSQIGIKDFFVNPQMGISGVYGLTYADLCNQRASHGGATSIFGVDCGMGSNAPRELLALSGPLSDLGRMLLTEKGADLHFLAYEIWSFAQGDYTLSIPKDTLIKFSARDFWGERAPAF
jgi:hypothetical protein